jgi:hypothetical protein
VTLVADAIAKYGVEAILKAVVQVWSNAGAADPKRVVSMKNEPRSRTFHGGMVVSTRVRFLRGDARWEEYMVDLECLAEVRSIDFVLNRYAPHGGDEECEPLTLAHALGDVPPPTSEREYVQLAVNRDGPFAGFTPEGFVLLGHDLCDDTHTSSLLNCGFWTGNLATFYNRLNAVGLLSLDDARAAQAALLREYPGMDHADADVWALFEYAPLPGSSALRAL